MPFFLQDVDQKISLIRYVHHSFVSYLIGIEDAVFEASMSTSL